MFTTRFTTTTTANVGKDPWAHVANFPTRDLTCDDFDEIVRSDPAVCLLVVKGNVPSDQTTSLETPTAGGSVQRRCRPTTSARAGPLARVDVRSPPRVSTRVGLDNPGKAARNAAAAVDRIAPVIIVDSRDACRPRIPRVDADHCGALPLPPKGNVGGDNPTAPTHEICVNVDSRLNVDSRWNETMSNQN